jgi:hypothetical protein
MTRIHRIAVLAIVLSPGAAIAVRHAASSGPNAPIGDAPIGDAPAAATLAEERRLSRAEKIAAAAAAEAEFLGAFEAEAIDRAWAPVESRRIADAVQSAVAGVEGLRNVAVECRASRCLATLTWTDRDAALVALEPLMRAGEGCAAFVFMPDSSPAVVPYTHRVRTQRCGRPD